MAEKVLTTPGKGFLGWVERTGNRLPDPVFIFFYLIILLMIISLTCWALGVSAQHPTQLDTGGNPVVIKAKSLLSPDNIRKFWVDMPKTFTHFPPLGYVLVAMLGAGVAERSGLFASAIRASVRNAPRALLTPTIALIAMLSNHATDAGYVVMIPLAAVIFAAAGRHPLAGIACAFAGVSGGFSANIAPGQLDALLYGITEAGYEAAGIDGGWTANIAGNTYLIIALLIIYLPIIWWVTDKIIEPRLGTWAPDSDSDMSSYSSEEDKPLTDAQRKGLRWALNALIGVVLLWVVMTIGPGTPLIDETACPPDDAAAGNCSPVTNYGPFFRSLVGGFLALFLFTGWAYGAAAKTINTHKDLVNMMSEAMKDMGYYLVLAFAAAHFVAMFGWSNLGLISAVHGAGVIEASGLPLPIVLGLIIVFAALLNLFVGSASAKWALLAPVLVPMLMLLGISPDASTAAYRVGDGATNIITPLMVYFPLVLVFAQRWKKDFGLGSLTAMMIPYSIYLLISGIILVMAWIMLGLPFGPGAPATIKLVTG
ncbi:MAG: AbgT family transporter [Hyphomonadaceae bacterium]|nr:AbgT family transporter [Hyphomonadaceae bacterium]MBC6411632.1 AbgT family transporter [Hyphomonadaceae bacterium]